VGQDDAAAEFAQRYNVSERIGVFDDTVESAWRMNEIAFSLYGKGEYGKAEPLFVRSLSISEKVLGLNHPNTQTYRRNLEGLRQEMQSFCFAQGSFLSNLSTFRKFERTFSLFSQFFSIEHPALEFKSDRV
jgi:Tetratricopeptide repeat